MSVLNGDEFHAQVVNEGGATRQIHSLAAVTGKGYAVGGRPGAKEVSVPVDQFTARHVQDHLMALHASFGSDPSIHQGGWREGGNAILDASDVYSSKSTAINTGLRRGERAIYDMAKGSDFNLPRVNRVKIK